jgi:two-component system nitrogen regulation sensor histidine kinase GlnL
MATHPSVPDDLTPAFAGLDLLSSAVIVLSPELRIRYANPAAENLFAVSSRQVVGQPISRLVGEAAGLQAALDNAIRNRWGYTGHNITVRRQGEGFGPLHLDCTVTPIELGDARLLLEFRPIDQLLKVAREERLIEQQQAHRELIRNLAHEVKNPLGGIRGSAQLLERELDDSELREYTQIIIKESDRLQDLMGRLLHSHRAMQPSSVSPHEILERVRRLISAEFPEVKLIRDYDTSLPDLTADREQLIQAVLNIVRNAAQAMGGHGEIRLRTRAQRQATLAKKRYRLALELQVIDNGPGIPAEMREQIFYPLVSGREGGSGLGLTIAQGVVHQHHGTIEVESRPGRTCFTILLPYTNGTQEAR